MIDKLNIWKEKFAESITSRGRKPAKTTIKNHYTQLRKIDLSGTKEEVMQRMKGFIKGNNNPKHIVDAFKSYIKVIYAEEFNDSKELEEFTDQLGKFSQLPRDEIKKMKQRSIPREVQIGFVTSLPEGGIDKLRMKCLAMAQLSSSRRYKDIVNCRVDDFKKATDWKGYILEITHGKGESTSLATIQDEPGQMIIKLIQTILHTKNRKVKINPFIFVPERFISSGYEDIVASLNIEDYNKYYESYKLYIVNNSIKFKKFLIPITPHVFRAWGINTYDKRHNRDRAKGMMYSDHKSLDVYLSYVNDLKYNEVYKDIDQFEMSKKINRTKQPEPSNKNDLIRQLDELTRIIIGIQQKIVDL